LKISVADPDPGSGIEKKIRIRDHFSESLETVFTFTVGLKILNSSMRIWIRDLVDPGSGMEKFGSGIRSKHPGFATLLKIVPGKYMHHIGYVPHFAAL
jgi:hypothetical protein